MAEFSFPFDVSVAGDRTVTADTFGTMLNAMVTNGVVKDADNGLAITQSGTPAMSVAVNTGRAFVGHTSKRRYYRNTASLTLTIEAADSSNPRDDLIVLEMKEATGTRSVALAVVKGTAAGSPSDPSLTTTEATFQFAIARVRVGAGVSTIVNANITDLRSTNGFAGMALGTGEVSQLTEDTIASGDFIAFSDESETGDPSNKITVDNLMETGLPLITEDTVAVASDYMVFLDGGASGNANKESIAHFVSAIAGTGLSESSGQLVVTETGDISGVTAGDGISGGGTTGAVSVAVDLATNSGLEIDTAKLQIAKGISEHDVPQFTSGVADDDFLRVAGTVIEGRSASEVLSDIGGQATLTFGISNTNAVKIDGADIADDEYARFTANGLESRTAAEVAADIEGSIDAVGALDSGSITSGFTSIDVGSGAITTTGTLTGETVAGTTFSGGEAAKVDFGDTDPADNAATGIVFSFTAGATLAIGDVVYMHTDGEVAKADADAVTTMPAIGICVSSGTDGNAVDVMVQGVMHDTSAFPTFTVGNDVYVGTTAGAVQTAAPSGSGDTVQKVGVATHADKIYFNFNTTEVLLA